MVVSVQEFPKSNAGNRYVMVNSNAIDTLECIHKVRCGGEFLFSEKGKRIRSSCFRRIDAKVDDSIVAEQMGHVNIETTRKYYYFSNKGEEKKREHINCAISF